MNNIIGELLILNDLIEVSKTWNEYLPGCKVLSYYDLNKKRIVVEVIKIPVSYRRQGYCGQILDEIITIARAYYAEVWLQPSDLFGVPVKILVSMYEQYGFNMVEDGWMMTK